MRAWSVLVTDGGSWDSAFDGADASNVATLRGGPVVASSVEIAATASDADIVPSSPSLGSFTVERHAETTTTSRRRRAVLRTADVRLDIRNTITG